jgi:hypothetical protein
VPASARQLRLEVGCDFVLGSFFARGERYVSKEAPVNEKAASAAQHSLS